MTPYFHNPSLQKSIDRAALIAFDLNGLIIDDEPVQYDSVNLALEPLDLHITEEYWIGHCVGKRADEYFAAILREHGISGGTSSISRLVRDKNRLYHELITSRVHALARPGVLELIDYLSYNKPVHLALCTSAHPDEIETILGKQGLGLKERFSYVISGLDVTRSKPDSETYHTLTAVSSYNPASCLVFEDSGLGVQSAVGAGMACIAVPNRYTLHQSFDGALFIIDNMTTNAGILEQTRR